jgi:hypothetical protein
MNSISGTLFLTIPFHISRIGKLRILKTKSKKMAYHGRPDGSFTFRLSKEVSFAREFTLVGSR